jgi:hypothetical protein
LELIVRDLPSNHLAKFPVNCTEVFHFLPAMYGWLVMA